MIQNLDGIIGNIFFWLKYIVIIIAILCISIHKKFVPLGWCETRGERIGLVLIYFWKTKKNQCKIYNSKFIFNHREKMDILDYEKESTTWVRNLNFFKNS